jgi:large repetitive protein
VRNITTVDAQDRPTASRRWGPPSATRGSIGAVVLALVAGLLPLFAIAPAAHAAPGELSFVAAASTAGNRTNHTVAVPTAVEAGDALVLYLTTNTTSTTIGGNPTGWTLLQSRDGTDGIRGRAWTKTAVAADAGANVTVTTSGTSKSVIGVAAYRSTGSASVSASAIGGSNTGATSHSTPQVTVAEQNSWLVNVWTGKSSAENVTWTLPGNTVSRDTQTGSGSGNISGVLGDSGAAVATGVAPPRTATAQGDTGTTTGTTISMSRSVMLSLVVSPGDLPQNQAPTASFVADCTGLTCHFDASSSSDPDDDQLTYSWNFGDGQTGTGVSAERTYGSDGQRTVTLTVSDGTDSDQATRTVNPVAAVSQGNISFVAAASTSGNRSGHTVRIPASVRPNDRLLLFLTTNSTSGTLTDAIPGWTLLQTRNGNGIRGRLWTRLATGADPDSDVSVSTSVLTKSVLSLTAYRSTGVPTVSASAVRGVDGLASSHATPTVPVGRANSWLVNYWGEKSSTTQTWTLPNNVTSRSTTPTGWASTGSGKVSAVLGDSNDEVPLGTAAARTATTSSDASRSVMFSVVIDPGVDHSGVDDPPTAEFTSGCSALTCEFDASRSFDPDDDELTYDWNFGDGQTGTGKTPTHTYGAATTRTVTLTVRDRANSDDFSSSVTLTNLNPAPGHNRLAPDSPRTNLPLISSGEIWDIEVVGNQVYVAGGFTSLRNQTATNTTTVNQAYLAAYDLSTGLISTQFRPVFGEGTVDAVEASPDGTKLYVAGTFNTVNGVTKRNIARLNPTTGAPIEEFTANANNKVNELAVTNTTVYAGGRFTSINNVPRSALVAVDGTTGAVRSDFVNNITGGIGTNGELAVQRLKLSRDEGRLLVVHTGRQVNGQDRYGIALINARTSKLLPWRTRLWEDNLQFVGGVQRIYGGDIAPSGDWFAVSSGSGGDRPPINDTVVAYPMEGGDDVQPKWISRLFDSVYSVAISEQAVYVGGHFSWHESPTSPQPWPGLDDVGYGTGQGLSGYGLGDAVVRREHIGALNPVDGTAVEWNPWSNSFEGDKYIEVTSRGVFAAGDGNTKGEFNVGRVAFYDFNSVAAPNGVETTISEPIEGRVEPVNEEFQIKGTASAPSGVQRVQVEVMDRNTRRYLNDDMRTWGTTTSNWIPAALASPNATSSDWSLPLTFAENRSLKILARTVAVNNVQDPTKATKKMETFGLTDRPPTTSVTGPSGSVIPTKTFVITGSATDDVGVNSVSLTVRDGENRYLQDDGTVSATYNAFRITPDVVGAPSTTWSYEVTVPTEGTWQVQARATDTAGQGALDTSDRQWLVSSTGIAPSVAISQPVAMQPPTAAQPVVVEPGRPITFSGSATDDQSLNSVEIQLRNNTTREQLAADGTWGANSIAGWHRISPTNLSDRNYNWSYTTPFNLSPGSYTFSVRAEDNLGLTTSSTNQGRLTLNAQIPGDAPPNVLISPSGTVTGVQVLHLDLAGTATDDKGVASVRVSLQERNTRLYVQPNGTMAAAYATRNATLATPSGTSTNWTLPIDLPTQGDFDVTAFAVDTAGQQNTSTTGTTARYPIYPGDNPPGFDPQVGVSPPEGTQFTDGKIFVSGRALDDQAMQRVEVGIMDALGRYMSSTGTFTSTTASWRTAFLNSPGTPGSNFSYTTPVIPGAGAMCANTTATACPYTVLVRAVDQHDQVTPVPLERHVTVTHPPGNQPPVASFTVSGCPQTNVCTFDARGSTDENAPTLSYTWNFGNNTTGSGPLPTRTYTAAGTYSVVLTARDEWGATATATQTVTITEPTNNVPPEPVINPPSCAKLVCNISGVGSADPNTGDTFTYLWNFGDGTPTSTTSAVSHTFPSAGTYTVTLTVTDGWLKAKSTTRTVTVSAD